MNPMDRKWRLIVHGRLPGALNMAIDEAIMACHANGETPPTFRVYGWSPPALSLGSIQRATREVDREAARKAGIDVVRRPTGGRAVLHDDEVTYSIVVAEDNPLIPKGLRQSYEAATGGIALGLRRLGVEAEVVGRDSPRRQRGDGACVGSMADKSAGACFDSASWYEVCVHGRKIVGSAQYRREGILLQHGSILISLDPWKLVNLFKIDEARKQAIAADLVEKAVGISQVTGRPISFDEVAEAVVAGVEEFLGIEFVRSDLTDHERELSEQLAKEKYGSDSWTYRR